MPSLAVVNTSSILDYATSVLKTANASIGVDTVLSPDGLQAPGVQRWVCRTGGIQVGYPTLTLSVRKPTRQSRLTRITVKFSLPTLEVTAPTTVTGIQPAPTRAYDHSVIMEFFLPERGTEAERTAFLSHVISLFVKTINASDDVPTNLSASPLRDAIVLLEPIYGS